jgi:arylsulfatase A-like enzyme
MGKLMDFLNREGLAENTILIFLTDNDTIGVANNDEIISLNRKGEALSSATIWMDRWAEKEARILNEGLFDFQEVVVAINNLLAS